EARGGAHVGLLKWPRPRRARAGCWLWLSSTVLGPGLIQVAWDGRKGRAGVAGLVEGVVEGEEVLDVDGPVPGRHAAEPGGELRLGDQREGHRVGVESGVGG